VRKAYRIGYPGKEYAIKSMQRKQCEKNIELLEKELSVMMKLDSPYLTKFHEVYYDDDYVNIVTELCAGNTIKQLLEEQPNQRFPEEEARQIIRNCLVGLNHLHSLEIAHRDLKPENIIQAGK